MATSGNVAIYNTADMPAILENIDLDPLEYGYRLTEDSNLVSVKSTKLSVLSNFPQPCKCQKCSKAIVSKF